MVGSKRESAHRSPRRPFESIGNFRHVAAKRVIERKEDLQTIKVRQYYCEVHIATSTYVG